MTPKTVHPHAEFLAEAAQDTSRKVEVRHIWGNFWEESTLSFVAVASPSWEFRFADTAHKVVSSLTDYDLCAIVDEHNSGLDDINFGLIRAVANAAAARQDTDIAEKQAASLRDTTSYRLRNFADKDMSTSEELAARYKKSKFRIF